MESPHNPAARKAPMAETTAHLHTPIQTQHLGEWSIGLAGTTLETILKRVNFVVLEPIETAHGIQMFATAFAPSIMARIPTTMLQVSNTPSRLHYFRGCAKQTLQCQIQTSHRQAWIPMEWRRAGNAIQITSLEAQVVGRPLSRSTLLGSSKKAMRNTFSDWISGWLTTVLAPNWLGRDMCCIPAIAMTAVSVRPQTASSQQQM